MRWRTGRRSSNVDDRRGRGGFGGFRPRGGFRLPGRMPRTRRGGVLGGGIGTVLLLLLALVFGFDPSILLQSGGSLPQLAPAPQSGRAESQDQLADFVSVVLADTEDTWHVLFEKMQSRYQEPTLVLFRDQVRSACGFASAATGPFYCPGDQKIYIDLSFYDEMQTRFGAPGDFAQAYVIAHEVGHHVQTLLGISHQVQRVRAQVSETESNQLSVMVELQADCFAGLWAHHAHEARNILERGDVEEALNAASAIGDDRMQRRAQGYVVPESFTHGSSEQRMRWFRAGLESGRLDACDTFNAPSL
ncbi:MAG: neutral zinc metallopeptidase [Geminicoccaceae bacterium]